ncbi:hypothetical protein PIB30_020759 [Stylosanthes scabra]|uniref:Uncharacterized protein n=1 Tax=Stylosanthes scabra TaxID=79078 RepID=A0ABU6Q9B3_9FABA|nr:hypothetical protein [Stylosanthes scabra]
MLPPSHLGCKYHPRALPTIFNLENTRHQNWALHIHNFLLEEVQKAKDNSTSSVSGCCFALMVIYFHETHFGKNSREAKAQPPWIQYWTGKTLWDRMIQEKTMRAGLIRTANAPLINKGKQKKNTRNGSSSKSEYINSDSDYEEGYDSDSEQTRSETLVRVGRKSKRKRDSVPALVPVLGVHDPDSDSDGQKTLGQAMLRRKRKNVEGHGSRSKRTMKPRDSPTHSKEDDASNAESANQFLHGHEELHQQPHNQPPEEEETQPQPPPEQVLAPKVEADLVALPRDMLLTDTLLRMRNDEQPNKEDENDPALNEVHEQQQEPQQQQQQEQQEQQEEEEEQQQQQQKRNNLHNRLLK